MSHLIPHRLRESLRNHTFHRRQNLLWLVKRKTSLQFKLRKVNRHSRKTKVLILRRESWWNQTYRAQAVPHPHQVRFSHSIQISTLFHKKNRCSSRRIRLLTIMVQKLSSSLLPKKLAIRIKPAADRFLKRQQKGTQWWVHNEIDSVD